MGVECAHRLPHAVNSARGSWLNLISSSPAHQRPAGRQLSSHLSLIVLALLLTFTLGLTIYAPQELGSDGYLSAGLALGSPGDSIAYLANDQHPPLFYLILRAWFFVAGRSFLGARWLSLAGILIGQAALYCIGRRLGGRRLAAFATLLYAANPAAVSAGATVRDYSLGLGLSLLALLTSLRLAARPSARGVLACTLINAAALLTWYFHIAFLLASAVAAAVKRKAALPLFLALGGGVALTFAWLWMVIPVLLARAGTPQQFGASPSRQPVPQLLLTLLSQFSFGAWPSRLNDRWGPLLFGLLWMLVAAAGVVALLRRDSWRSGAVTVAGLGAGLALFVFLRSAWATDASPRYLLAALPFAFVAQAAALSLASRLGGAGVALCGAWVVVSLGGGLWEFQRVHALPPLPWESDPVLQYVETSARPGDALFFFGWGPYSRYLLRNRDPLSAYGLDVASPEQKGQLGQLMQPKVAAMEDASRVWFVNEHSSDEASSVLLDSFLESGFYFVDQQTIKSPVFDGQGVVRQYASARDVQPHPLGLTLDSRVTLATAGYPASVHPGGVLPVDLEWHALRNNQDNYSVFVHFVSSNGQMVAQHDGWPAAGLRPTSRWQPGDVIHDRLALALPASLTSGSYRLIAGMYVGDSRLALADGMNSIELGSVAVT